MSTDVLPRPRNRFRAERRFPTIPRMAQVAAIEHLDTGMVRVSFTGHELGEFTRNGTNFPAMESHAFDDVVILCFPDPESGQFFGPGVHDSRNPPLSEVCSWQAREYTVRRFCQREKLLIVDFALHASGIAESWLRDAVVGDHLGIIGTRMSRELPTEPHILAIGDATALPALARLVESVPESSRLKIFLVADQESLGRSFPSINNADIKWIDPFRNPVSRLMELLAVEPLPCGTWAWIAGEASQVGMIRRHLVDEHCLDKDRIHFTGYWKSNDPSR